MALCGVGMRLRACKGAALTDQGTSFVRGARAGLGRRRPAPLLAGPPEGGHPARCWTSWANTRSMGAADIMGADAEPSRIAPRYATMTPSAWPVTRRWGGGAFRRPPRWGAGARQ